jgi:hypothetical protein
MASPEDVMLARRLQLSTVTMSVTMILMLCVTAPVFAATQGAGKEALREKCRAQVRAQAIIGSAGASAEHRRRENLFRLCMQKGGMV